MKLFNQSQVQELIDERLASHKWWFLFGSSEAIGEIQQRFYGGEANGDFHLIMGWGLNRFDKIGQAFGPGFGAFAMAKKSRASATEMAQFLATLTPGISCRLDEVETGQRDCLFLFFAPAPDTKERGYAE